ncbi:ABC transporter substrate-binding protein [Pseudoroseomonas cervicalis]|uniref:ABC transporter substrate-binding protein n=1 Tax=Teichococcus cervicalis TaxID=204525 RepID=UPI002784AB7A|nr:ABC transporter substrate-binding protein [Pseudoroseomonas cervicalis]MDQ1077757.1 peptide/nickel transport system substrate-binding protein [Pseudoroseomonas cervicalis]
MRPRSMALAALVALAAWPLAAWAQETPQRGGRATVALNADIRSLEPGINRDANTDAVVHHIFEGLVAYRTDVSVGPALAESWSVSEDGLSWRFTLREGVRFHNGATLTSAEVKASWDRQWGNSGWSCRRFFDSPDGLQVQAVEAEDARTITYRLARPSALLLPQLANIQCGTVVFHPDSIGADGKWRAPIGTGPFQLQEWRRGEFVTLRRFDGYVASTAPASAFSGARQALLDEVVFRVIPDPNAAEAALLTGAVDILPSVEPERADKMREAGVQMLTAPGLGWTTMLVQTRDAVLKDVRIRRAIAHAIDLAQIAEVRTGGGAGPNPSAVGDSSPFFDEAFRGWPAYDPAAARRLLREAGYRNQLIKIQANRRYPGMYDNAVAIQSMLTAVGLRVELEVLDWATQLNNYLNGNFQLQSFSYSARLDPSLMFNSIIGDKTAQPWAQWEDPEARRLLAESITTTDNARRGEVFRALHARMQQEVPIIGLYYDPQLGAARPTIRGYAPQVAGRMITWGVWRQP